MLLFSVVVDLVVTVSGIVDSHVDVHDVMVVSIDACGVTVVIEVCVSVCV